MTEPGPLETHEQAVEWLTTKMHQRNENLKQHKTVPSHISAVDLITCFYDNLSREKASRIWAELRQSVPAVNILRASASRGKPLDFVSLATFQTYVRDAVQEKLEMGRRISRKAVKADLDNALDAFRSSDEIRRTEDGLFSVFDVIRFVAQVSNPHDAWVGLRAAITWNSHMFPGPGQRPTPVADIRNVFRLINLIPGKTAAAFRAKGSDTFLRVLGADTKLIDELISRREAMDEDPGHVGHVYDGAVADIDAEAQTPSLSYPNLKLTTAIGNDMVTMAQPHYYVGQPGTNCGIDPADLKDPCRPFAILKAGVSMGVNDRQGQHARTYDGFTVLDRIPCPPNVPAEMLIKRYLREVKSAVSAQVARKNCRESETFIVYSQEEYHQILWDARQLIEHCCSTIDTEDVKLEREKRKAEEARTKAEEARTMAYGFRLELKKLKVAQAHCPNVLCDLLLNKQ